MKKVIAFGAASMLAFALGTTAATPANLMQAEARARVCTFTDRNRDGICDRCSNRCAHRSTRSASHHSSHHSSHHHS